MEERVTGDQWYLIIQKSSLRFFTAWWLASPESRKVEALSLGLALTQGHVHLSLLVK